MFSSTDHGGFTLRLASWALDRADLCWVRRLVFIEEQGVPSELEWDGEDESAIHLLAHAPMGEAGDALASQALPLVRPIGTARVMTSGQIGRMAVLAPWRGQGVGSALLAAALAAARDAGHRAPFLHAQTQALGFYRRRGFHPEGPEFREAGIPHRRMIYGDGHE